MQFTTVVMKRDDEQANDERTNAETRDRRPARTRKLPPHKLEPRWERLCDQASD